MEIRVGTFLRAGVDGAADGDFCEFAVDALRSYITDSRRLGVPTFLGEDARAARGSRLDLPVDADLAAQLAAEGRRQSARAEEIARHAIFVKLAAIDRGADLPPTE